MVLGRTSHVSPDEQQTPENRAAQANDPDQENNVDDNLKNHILVQTHKRDNHLFYFMVTCDDDLNSVIGLGLKGDI